MKKSGWINSKTVKPEKPGWYFTCVDVFGVPQSLGVNYYSEKVDKWIGENGISKTVDYWMPAPDIPKESASSQDSNEKVLQALTTLACKGWRFVAPGHEDTIILTPKDVADILYIDTEMLIEAKFAKEKPEYSKDQESYTRELIKRFMTQRKDK